ncbi:unnamed protein product [Anisakis simplex]|uniref:Uncharacterized protein n=1 Tax=Anisakis simplex TaxID=6269 RepID=A0A3P6UM53_ANISI|nr:unnamed protein product [Anisakis simplex]
MIDQVEKMRINLGLHLRDTNVSALIGGKPGTNIKLHHAGALHSSDFFTYRRESLSSLVRYDM